MLSPSTELDAINTMLSSIGEAPVNAVEDSGVVDAVMARNILRSTSREVQSRGWHYNTDKDYVLTPTYPDKEIRIPLNAIRVDTVGTHKNIDVVVRGNKLYDRRRHTFQFDQAVTVDMIVLLDFDDIPEAARVYITLRSARIFQERVVGSADLSQFTQRDELRALVAMQEHEADTADYNMLTDSYDVWRVLDR